MLTKECDYAIRIVRCLSDRHRKTVEAISTAEFIPHQYAYKILKKLENAEFVKGIRGRDGGYRLIKPLDTFTIYDVVIAIDKNMLVHECLRTSHVCPHKNAGKSSSCLVHNEFGRIQEIFSSELMRNSMQNILMPEGKE